MSIDELLEEILSVDTIPDIVNYGKCIHQKECIDKNGRKVEFFVYEYNGKTYIAQYVDGQTEIFDELKNFGTPFA